MNSGDQETAATMRLRRSDPSSPGIRRRRCGAGFRYLAPDGSPIRDPETLERIRGLVIPPAWREVWVCTQPNGHIQAVGLDDADRRQYLYHPRWRRARDEEKYERVLQLAGDEFTVKDLRTWHATVLAAIALADAGPATSQRARKRAVAAAMREVADELGNTAAVARRSYVDPRVLRAYESGTTLRPELRNGSIEREEAERAVMRLLRATGE